MYNPLGILLRRLTSMLRKFRKWYVTPFPSCSRCSERLPEGSVGSLRDTFHLIYALEATGMLDCFIYDLCFFFGWGDWPFRLRDIYFIHESNMNWASPVRTIQRSHVYSSDKKTLFDLYSIISAAIKWKSFTLQTEIGGGQHLFKKTPSNYIYFVFLRRS